MAKNTQFPETKAKKSIIDFGVKKTSNANHEGYYEDACSEASTSDAESDISFISNEISSSEVNQEKEMNLFNISIKLVSHQMPLIDLKTDDLLMLLKKTYLQVCQFEKFIKSKKPAVSINDSIHPNHLKSMEDGSEVVILAKHVKKYGLTVEQYKAKWGLPSTYPNVPENYSKARHSLAMKTGLGKNRKASAKNSTTLKRDTV